MSFFFETYGNISHTVLNEKWEEILSMTYENSKSIDLLSPSINKYAGMANLDSFPEVPSQSIIIALIIFTSLTPNLSSQAQRCHIFKDLYSDPLISIGQLCDDNWIAVFSKNLTILKDNNTKLESNRRYCGGTPDVLDGLEKDVVWFIVEDRNFSVRIGVRVEKVLTFFLEVVVLGFRFISSSLIFVFIVSIGVGTCMMIVERNTEGGSNSMRLPVCMILATKWCSSGRMRISTTEWKQ